MNWTTDCAVVIPCLNEEGFIGPLVATVRQQLPSVLVVDDGSTDGTAFLAARAGAQVVRHETTQGKGAALRTGLQHVRDAGYEWALTMDGDGQHAPEDIPRLLEVARRTRARLVIGNRMGDPAGMPRLRRIVNRWMSRRISAAAGLPLPDSQCGFRLMHLETWASLPIRATHFEIESDTLLAFAAHNCRIEFVPIQVIYKTEQSKIHPWRDTLRWFRWWRQVRRSRKLKTAAVCEAPATAH
jgi:glycosyltransferase involved in cell wall biosynthesis